MHSLYDYRNTNDTKTNKPQSSMNYNQKYIYNKNHINNKSHEQFGLPYTLSEKLYLAWRVMCVWCRCNFIFFICTLNDSTDTANWGWIPFFFFSTTAFFGCYFCLVFSHLKHHAHTAYYALIEGIYRTQLHTTSFQFFVWIFSFWFRFDLTLYSFQYLEHLKEWIWNTKTTSLNSYTIGTWLQFTETSI